MIGGIEKTVAKIIRPILITEILRAHRFLAGEFTPEERAELGQLTDEQLMAEARVAGAAVELRQKSEVAEYMRRTLATQEAQGAPTRGPMS
jgi:hypothetical protein